MDLNQADELLKSALVFRKFLEIFQVTALSLEKEHTEFGVNGGYPKLFLEDNHSRNGNWYLFLAIVSWSKDHEPQIEEQKHIQWKP